MLFYATLHLHMQTGTTKNVVTNNLQILPLTFSQFSLCFLCVVYEQKHYKPNVWNANSTL